MKIRKVINKVILGEQAEENNFTVDTFSPMINENENIINKVNFLTINNVVNDPIDKVANMTINGTVNNLIGFIANLTINNNPAGKNHQNLLSSLKIGIRHKNVPVLNPLMEASIGASNQPDLTISTGIIHAPQVLNTPTMEEVIANMTDYNT